MNYRLKDPNRTSYRFPFYGLGAENLPGAPSVGTTPAASPTNPTVPIGSPTTPTLTPTTSTPTTPTTTTSKFSYLSPILAFGTSALASYIVARHIQIDKPKAMNLAITLGLLSGIGQVAAQILEKWIAKAAGSGSTLSSLINQ